MVITEDSPRSHTKHVLAFSLNDFLTFHSEHLKAQFLYFMTSLLFIYRFQSTSKAQFLHFMMGNNYLDKPSLVRIILYIISSQ